MYIFADISFWVRNENLCSSKHYDYVWHIFYCECDGFKGSWATITKMR